MKELKMKVDIAVNSLFDYVLIIDERGIIVEATKATIKVFGIKKEDIIEKNINDLEENSMLNLLELSYAFKNKGKRTFIYENIEGEKYIISTIPIKEKDMEIKTVVFSMNVLDYLKLKYCFDELEEVGEKNRELIENFKNNKKQNQYIIGNNIKIRNLINIIERIAKFDTNIILLGESGVGKTMFARTIHSSSQRKHGPFIEINCGAIPEGLLESELFGYEKGSFSGASSHGKIGLIEMANKGTLFLDEISDMPLNEQVKLLKVIQDKVLMRVGGTKPIDVDFRLITATNKDLERMVLEGKFREDLYYRLNVIKLEIPPLRERKDDIILLSNYFLQKYNEKYNMNKVLSSQVIDCFFEYNWPGNIREFQNIIENILLTSEEVLINVNNLPKLLYKEEKELRNKHEGMKLKVAIKLLEKEMVIRAYEKHKTTVGVAKELGISQPSAVRKIKEHITGNTIISI